MWDVGLRRASRAPGRARRSRSPARRGQMAFAGLDARHRAAGAGRDGLLRRRRPRGGRLRGWAQAPSRPLRGRLVDRRGGRGPAVVRAPPTPPPSRRSWRSRATAPALVTVAAATVAGALRRRSSPPPGPVWPRVAGPGLTRAAHATNALLGDVAAVLSPGPGRPARRPRRPRRRPRRHRRRAPRRDACWWRGLRAARCAPQTPASRVNWRARRHAVPRGPDDRGWPGCRSGSRWAAWRWARPRSPWRTVTRSPRSRRPLASFAAGSVLARSGPVRAAGRAGRRRRFVAGSVLLAAALAPGAAGGVGRGAGRRPRGGGGRVRAAQRRRLELLDVVVPARNARRGAHLAHQRRGRSGSRRARRPPGRSRARGPAAALAVAARRPGRGGGRGDRPRREHARARRSVGLPGGGGCTHPADAIPEGAGGSATSTRGSASRPTPATTPSATAAERKRRELAGTPMPQNKPRDGEGVLRPGREGPAAARHPPRVRLPAAGLAATRAERSRRWRATWPSARRGCGRRATASSTSATTTPAWRRAPRCPWRGDEAQAELAAEHRAAAKVTDFGERPRDRPPRPRRGRPGAGARLRRARPRDPRDRRQPHHPRRRPPRRRRPGRQRERPAREPCACCPPSRENAPGWIALSATLRARGDLDGAEQAALRVIEEDDENAYALAGAGDDRSPTAARPCAPATPGSARPASAWTSPGALAGPPGAPQGRPRPQRPARRGQHRGPHRPHQAGLSVLQAGPRRRRSPCSRSQRARRLVAGAHLPEQAPEGGGVVRVDEVARLVRHDVVEHVLGRQHQPPRERQAARRRCSSPSASGGRAPRPA